MKISVVIPAYNAQEHIARALDSVLKQTRPADEIIVINDGSTDNTGPIVRKYSSPVILIEQSNQGVSAARNAGIRAAKGDWIAFLDADDEWLPDKLRLQCQLLQRNPQLHWAGGNYYRCDCRSGHARKEQLPLQKQTDLRIKLTHPDIFDDYFTAFVWQAAGHTDTMIVKKTALLEAGLFCQSQSVMEDDDLWLRLAYRELQFGFVFEPLAIYHLEVDQSLSKIHQDSMLIDDYIARHVKLSQKAGKLPQFGKCARGILSYRIHLLMACSKGRDVRLLVRKYGDFLAPGFRTSCYLGSFCPVFWNTKEKIKNRIRAVLGRK